MENNILSEFQSAEAMFSKYFLVLLFKLLKYSKLATNTANFKSFCHYYFTKHTCVKLTL